MCSISKAVSMITFSECKGSSRNVFAQGAWEGFQWSLWEEVLRHPWGKFKIELHWKSSSCGPGYWIHTRGKKKMWFFFSVTLSNLQCFSLLYFIFCVCVCVFFCTFPSFRGHAPTGKPNSVWREPLWVHSVLDGIGECLWQLSSSRGGLWQAAGPTGVPPFGTPERAEA